MKEMFEWLHIHPALEDSFRQGRLNVLCDKLCLNLVMHLNMTEQMQQLWQRPAYDSYWKENKNPL